MTLTVGDIIGPSLTNMIDEGVNTLINNAISGFKLVQQSVLLQMIPQLVNQYGLALVNSQISAILGPQSICPPYIPPYSTAASFPSLPLMTSSIFAFARSKLEGLLMKGGGLDFAQFMQLVRKLSLSLSLSIIYIYKQTHTHTLSLSLAHSIALTHTHTHTYTLSLSFRYYLQMLKAQVFVQDKPAVGVLLEVMVHCMPQSVLMHLIWVHLVH